MEKRENRNGTPIWDVTILSTQREIGALDCVKYLVEKGANVDAKNERGYTALIFSAQHGRLDCLQHLVEEGAHINRKDKEGYTALMLAILERRRDCVKYLIAHGAILESEDKEKEQHLHQTAYKRHLSMCKSNLADWGFGRK